MKHLIKNYKSGIGEHCGSTAMRNLVNHYTKSNFTEEEIFGFGAGLNFIYLVHENIQPSIFINGRSTSMEVEVGKTLGLDYRETPEMDNEKAWELVKKEVLEGRPTMLSGDAYYLDYRDFRDHFPSHRFVLLGFDDEAKNATVSDRMQEAYDHCSYEALSNSRNPPNALSTFNMWGKFHSNQITNSLEEMHHSALTKMVAQMQGDSSENSDLSLLLPESCTFLTGLKGMKELTNTFSDWRDCDDWESIIKFTANAVEKYGSGGGNFRKMYCTYLKSAQKSVPKIVDDHSIELIGKSASIWKGFADEIQLLTPANSVEQWKSIGEMVSTAYDFESEAVERIASAL